MTKRIEWMTLPEWMGLTAEQHRCLDAYLKEQNAELGIDIDGSHTGGRQLQFEHDPDQLDRDEYIEDMSRGGKRYRVRR
jgi:hypothetical protein